MLLLDPYIFPYFTDWMKQIFSRLTKLENASQIQVAIASESTGEGLQLKSTALPLKTIHDLKELNQKLSDSDAERTALVSYHFVHVVGMIVLYSSYRKLEGKQYFLFV